jgi:hypothetical protein
MIRRIPSFPTAPMRSPPIKTSVTDNGEYSSIQQAYDQSSIEGQLTVTSKQVDCGAAVGDLADLDRAVASQPPAAVTTGASPPAAQVTTGAALPSSRHLPSMGSAPSNMFTTVATTGAAWWCWRQSRRPAQVSSISGSSRALGEAGRRSRRSVGLHRVPRGHRRPEARTSQRTDRMDRRRVRPSRARYRRHQLRPCAARTPQGHSPQDRRVGRL